MKNQLNRLVLAIIIATVTVPVKAVSFGDIVLAGQIGADIVKDNAQKGAVATKNYITTAAPKYLYRKETAVAAVVAAALIGTGVYLCKQNKDKKTAQKKQAKDFFKKNRKNLAIGASALAVVGLAGFGLNKFVNQAVSVVA